MENTLLLFEVICLQMLLIGNFHKKFYLNAIANTCQINLHFEIKYHTCGWFNYLKITQIANKSFDNALYWIVLQLQSRKQSWNIKHTSTSLYRLFLDYEMESNIDRADKFDRPIEVMFIHGFTGTMDFDTYTCFYIFHLYSLVRSETNQQSIPECSLFYVFWL